MSSGECRSKNGFNTVNDYASFTDYGIPKESFGVIIDATDDQATWIEVQVISDVE